MELIDYCEDCGQPVERCYRCGESLRDSPFACLHLEDKTGALLPRPVDVHV